MPGFANRTAVAWGLVTFVALLSSACASRSDVSPVGEADRALQGRLEPHYRLQRPEGPGPFPAVVMLPGCSGVFHPRAPNTYLRYADRLRASGQVVVVADYVSAEGIPEACRGRMSSDQVAAYVLAAANHLRSLSWVDASQIRVIGWSLGGGGVLASLRLLEGRPAPFRVALVLYPVCRDVQPWSSRVPATLLLAELDNIQPPEICRALIERLPAGVPVQVRSYDRAHHGFDWSELPTVTEPETGPTLGRSREAAAAAWEEILKFLRS